MEKIQEVTSYDLFLAMGLTQAIWPEWQKTDYL